MQRTLAARARGGGQRRRVAAHPAAAKMLGRDGHGARPIRKTGLKHMRAHIGATGGRRHAGKGSDEKSIRSKTRCQLAR